MTTVEILRGLRKLRGTSRTHASADILDAAIARIETDADELAKADRRTAEQEAVIAAQRVRIDELDGALTEGLAGWQSLVEVTTQCASWEEDADGRKIVELRKLTRTP